MRASWPLLFSCASVLGGAGCSGETTTDDGDERSPLSAGGTSDLGAGGSLPVAAAGGSSQSGGASPTGGALGTGGARTGTAAAPYDHGFSPTSIFVEDAQTAYQAWKDVHLEDCGSGRHRVRWENERLDATVSEGIGYGMLLAVMWDEQAALDGLFDYYKAAQNSNTGLMHWLRYGCGADYSTKYNPYPDGAAADADLDVAMALIMADCKWGGGTYASDASAVIAAIRTHMFVDYEGKHVLQPGDSEWFDNMGNGCVNYSYFAPAYYRVFSSYDAGNSDFWNQAADDAYDLLVLGSDPSSGLVRNWGSADGSGATSDCHNAYHRASSYGDDAARTPWRVATDYLWNGTPAAKSWNDKVTTWVKTVGIESTVQWYNLDGSQDTQANTYDDHTVINVGPWATGAMTFDQSTVDEFAAEVVDIPSGPSDHDGEYFPRMLKALSLATLVGKFTTCGG